MSRGMWINVIKEGQEKGARTRAASDEKPQGKRLLGYSCGEPFGGI